MNRSPIARLEGDNAQEMQQTNPTPGDTSLSTQSVNLQQHGLVQPSLPVHQQQQIQVVPHPFPVQTPNFPMMLAAPQQTTHNLIPPHLFHQQQQQQQQFQQYITPHLNGTPGYPPALISLPQIVPTPIPQAVTPVYTVQDRPNVQPVYNGVNPNYPGVRVIHTQPPIFCVDNFLTPFECEFLVQSAQDSFGPAPVVGKGAGEVSSSRTSSTCYLAREDLPDLMRKITLLTGKPPEHCELPQVGRYFPSQQYLQHFDAFDISNEDGRRFAANGGQRTVTCLIYLNTVHRGGATRFPALNLEVQPVQGMALIFFPATVDGFLDKMALHAALPAIDTKYVSQIWIRQTQYNGQPSKRLPQTLGVPTHWSPLGLSQLVPNTM